MAVKTLSEKQQNEKKPATPLPGNRLVTLSQNRRKVF